MLFIVYFTVGILYSTAFFVTEKKLCFFERIAALMAVLSVNSFVSTLLMTNWHLVIVPDGTINGLVRIVNMQVIEPITIVWFVDGFHVTRKSVGLLGYFLAVGTITLTAWILGLENVIRMSGALGWVGLVAKEALLPIVAFAAVRTMRFLMRKDGLTRGPVTSRS
ncbi:hypothetical protein [Cohnella candidum]|uniref:Uncharacterized protein n=1 Tax=Cohnella candidum TaxID=2674991 RepID=A0A3G3JXR8_9BACL|nr:hypothetical protein [Cohnella candidum]AYQ73035.1 hypothetical protein EAV92_10945 [Cohnella candidum]